MHVYNEDNAPGWMREEWERELTERNAQIATIQQRVVPYARQHLRDGEELRAKVAELLCNWQHSGIDVWSMLQGQKDRMEFWLTYADRIIEEQVAEATVPLV